MMQAGRLRHRVIIQQATASQNAYGEPVQTWAALATVWAEVRPATGQERFVAAGDQQLATLTHRVRMRYRGDVTPLMRVVWGSRVLDIESVMDPTGRTAETRLMCREVVGGANWWAVAGRTCVFAYQPIWATDLASSYINLADDPDTYDAAPGVAPTWNASTGWTFNGSTQYLATGWKPNGTSEYTLVSKVANAVGGTPIGRRDEGTPQNHLSIQVAGNPLTPAYYYQDVGTGGNELASNDGFYSVTKDGGYYNDSLNVSHSGSTPNAGAQTVNIGRKNYPVGYDWFTGDVLVISVYEGTLTLSEIGDLYNRVNAL